MMLRDEHHETVGRRSFLQRAALVGASAVGLNAGRRLAAPPGEGPTGGGRAALRVLVWCEGTAPRSVYPNDIDGAVAGQLAKHGGMAVARGRLDDPLAGLADPALDAADVLVWWGRLRHDDLPA